jgi:exopolysaccharide biosynthesis protein
LFKRLLLVLSLIVFLASNFLFLTPLGLQIREFLAETVITTQHREWAWIFVGAERRDQMVRHMQDLSDENAKEKQDIGMIKYNKNRPIESLVKVKDISGEYWKGKMMYVYDPTTIRVVVPDKQGEGERITSMVARTGAVAGVNGGGFVDPDGLGNGFAPIGAIMSGGKVLYTDQDGTVPQHIVGFTKEGTLIIGKYTINELLKMGVSEAVSFYPRVIANGKPLITSGDGGWGRAPRTAVGQREDGTVIFVVIDGRQAHSVGATLREVQDLLLEEGCINAGFLDGGASSELVYNNELITKPSSRYGERRLPSAFLVFDHPEQLHNKAIWDGLTEIDPGGAYDNPYYQAELKQKQQQAPKTTTSEKEKPASKPEASETSGSDNRSGTPSGAKPESGKTGANKHGEKEGGAGTQKPEPTTGTGSGASPNGSAATKTGAAGGNSAGSGAGGTNGGSSTSGQTAAPSEKPAGSGSGAAANGATGGSTPAKPQSGSTDGSAGTNPGTGSNTPTPTPMAPKTN